LVVEHRRDEVSLSPATAAFGTGSLTAELNDITRARIRRNVAAIGLSRVAQIYADYDAAQGDEAHVTQLLTDISEFLSKEAAS
jgi:hypothetical protein